MAQYEGNYKWSYKPARRQLTIWAVDSGRKAASPTHHDFTGPEGLLSCSQGRLIVRDGIATAVIYASRPINPDLSDECRDRIQRKARLTLEEEVELDIAWRIEE